MNAQLAGVVPGVVHGHVQLAGEALIAVGAGQGQPQGVAVPTLDGLGLPHPLAEALRAAVQVVFAVVLAQHVVAAFQIERRAADAVAHPTDERAHAAALAVVGIHHVEAQIHVGQLSVPVGHHDAGHNAAKVNDADAGTLVIGKRILGHFLAAGGFVKIFPGDTHEKCPPSEWNPVGFLPSAISVGMTDRQVLSLL